ncbi:unnamed protein product [Linum trigynum]|uniref:Uncharacterized protein n=1 Tax=Linum trigynum TaxID=586398 RepID=A0AAV2E633_9ROSI
MVFRESELRLHFFGSSFYPSSSTSWTLENLSILHIDRGSPLQSQSREAETDRRAGEGLMQGENNIDVEVKEENEVVTDNIEGLITAAAARFLQSLWR